MRPGATNTEPQSSRRTPFSHQGTFAPFQCTTLRAMVSI